MERSSNTASRGSIRPLVLEIAGGRGGPLPGGRGYGNSPGGVNCSLVLLPAPVFLSVSSVSLRTPVHPPQTVPVQCTYTYSGASPTCAARR